MNGPSPRSSVPDSPIDAVHDLGAFEGRARSVLPADVYDYVAGGAGTETTLRRNREALDSLMLVPRVLRAVNQIDTATTLLGQRLDWPVAVAPTAVQPLLHPDGELGTASACAATGTAMVLSMNSGTPLEAVAATGVDFAMQLYVTRDRGHIASIAERAEAAGATGLVVTVDQAGLAVRLRELYNPLRLPEWFSFVHLPDDPADRGVDGDLTWDDIEWLGGVTDLPIAVKGVLHPDDAAIAVDVGVDTIMVSNHGGRQLDGTVSAYDVLEMIVDRVDGKASLVADGAIRCGSDVIKALALGADAVMVGRATSWALAAGGTPGVTRALRLLRNEVEVALRLCGVTSVGEIDRSFVRSGAGR